MLVLFFCASLSGNNYTITIESSSDLNEWEAIHTATVSSEAANTFYRANIEATDEPSLILENSTLTVTQTWSQETDYARTAQVQVPNFSAEKYPVILFLHGAGGTGSNMLNQFSNHFENYIKVAMDGYLNKWNIKSEPTKADDVGFLNSIISQLKSYSNVDAQKISILGQSNGAGLVLKALIELPEDTFNHGIHMATQLSTDQYRNDTFWSNEYPNDQYTLETTLPNRSKIISFHGTNDSTIPYYGETVNFLNTTFYNAHESIHYFAKGMGYQGDILSGNGENTINPNIKEFSYLNQSVVHYQILNGGHVLGEYLNDIVSIIQSHIE